MGSVRALLCVHRCARIQLSLQMLSWVQVPVTIFDDKGAVAAHLKKNDFRLFDDGIEQNILYFERERVTGFIRSSRGLEFQHDEKDSLRSGGGSFTARLTGRA